MIDLLVDIGNSRLKWAILCNGKISAGQALVNQALDYARLSDTWRALPAPKRVAVSCVSAKRHVELVQTVACSLWPAISFIEAKSEPLAFGVRNAYLEPEKLGVDRWLALLATKADYPLPACIVDCGTAITIDLLDVFGKHLGGMICPGLELMKKSLWKGTDALSYSDAKYDAGPANHTQAAIYSGVLNAAVGLVEHVYAAQPEPCELILTGGDASLIAKYLAYACRIDDDLILRGLSRLLE